MRGFVFRAFHDDLHALREIGDAVGLLVMGSGQLPSILC